MISYGIQKIQYFLDAVENPENPGNLGLPGYSREDFLDAVWNPENPEDPGNTTFRVTVWNPDN